MSDTTWIIRDEDSTMQTFYRSRSQKPDPNSWECDYAPVPDSLVEEYYQLKSRIRAIEDEFDILIQTTQLIKPQGDSRG